MSAGKLREPAAALLVGGASTRMGRDKAHLRVGGRPLSSRTADQLDRLFEDLLLVGGDAPGDAPGRRVPDPDGPPAALRGIVGALAAARAERVLVVATDMPGLTPDLLLALVAAPESDVVLPRHDGRLHPLCAIYRRESVLPAARAALEASRFALRPLIDALDVTVLEGADLAPFDPGVALANLNTPDDWAAYQAREAGR